MSGQQIGTIAGQVIGAYVGGPFGAAVGGVIGGYLGGSFDPDIVNEGPKLTDLHVQLSSYGAAIPIFYGSARFAGNVIWATDFREIAVETEVDGKGGPDTVNKEFQYELDCHILLADHEIVTIERIFANGVLIWDTRFGSSAANVFANGQWQRGIQLYRGTEDQLPDPTYEAAVGVGNADARRGRAYVSIIGLNVTVLKTTILPNFEFVAVQAGTQQQFIRKVAIDNLDPSYRKQTNPSAPRPRITFDQGLIRLSNDANANVYTFDMDGNELGAVPQNEFEAQRPITYDAGEDIYGFWRMHDDTNAYCTPDGAGANTADLSIGVFLASSFISGTAREFTSFTQCNGDRYILAMVRTIGEEFPDEWIRFEWTGGDDGELLVDESGPISAEAQTEVANLGIPTAAFPASYRASFAEEDLKTIWTATGAEDLRVEIFQIDEAGVLQYLYPFVLNGGGDPSDFIGAGMQDMIGAFSRPTVYAEEGLAFIVADDALFIYSRMIEVQSDGVELKEILADVCDRSNIPSGEIDVTDQTQIVLGYVIGTTSTARAAIEQLRPAFYFDAVDGDQLKFVNRGSAPIVTFEYDDLGAGEGNASPVAVGSAFSQETELPARWNLSYISINSDYQIGAQSARRETTNSQEIQNVQLAVVMDDQYAAQVCDVNMRDAWAGSVARKFSTGLKYAKYEPTDVVLLDDGFVIRQIRLTKRIDRGASIDWESVDEDSAVYDSNAIGMDITAPSQVLTMPGPTDVEVLDLPPLTELPSGNEAAAKVAARGFLPGWTGALIEISRNNGGSYTPGTTISNASIMGVAITELDDFAGGNVFDESSAVRVNVGSSTLSSAVRLDVLNGTNACVIGDEILAFRNATLVSAGVYDLTGLLRGRKGTEWAMDDHAAGERFVMLTTNLRDLPLLISDRTATSLLVRATSAGGFGSAASSETFTTQLARLMPYSPVHLNGTRDGSDNWHLTWVRRDRYLNDWPSGVEVPMSETAELYDVEILDTGVVVESYTNINDTYIDVPSSVLGAVTSIDFRVYQKSSLVGRGFVAEKTVTQT